ncbi:MAG: TAXI family TRAP transporter solute-binding subunit, partial [Terriglobia bacterium]
MSADVPKPEAGMPPARSRVARRNQRQMLLFAALTLLLTVVAVWCGHVWLRDSETLVFAVGDANGLEARFAARLATVLKNSSSRLHLKIVPNGDNSRALAEFDHRQADIAVLRTDAKVPPHARALAVLEHDVVLLISP